MAVVRRKDNPAPSFRCGTFSSRYKQYVTMAELEAAEAAEQKKREAKPGYQFTLEFK